MDSSRQPCKYFQQGSCKYGQECMYSHDTLVNKLSDVRPGRVGYRPKYPNMTLDNQFRVNETPSSNTTGQRERPVGNSANGPSLAERRPGRVGYKPTYKKSTSPTRTSASSHVNKNINNNSNNQSTFGNKQKKKGRKGKGTLQPNHDPPLDDRRKSALQAAATRPPAQPQSTQVTPEQLITHDLTNVQPQWPFSCYGISTDWSLAGNIIEGVDYSPEELRLQALSEWKNTGTIQQYMNDVQQLKMYVENKRQSVLFNPAAALSDALSRRVLPAGTPVMNVSLNPTNMPNLSVNPTTHIPQPSMTVMQDDQSGAFHLGAVPLEPPI